VELILANSKNDTVRTKTILYDVYNHSINNRERGKELLLLTDVIERTANSLEYFTQVIFNRAIVQVGLLAFRNGNMYEVQGALSDLCSYGRTKELLGQGFNKQMEKENLRNKILPYHLHINIDMVESVELIAAMILEIPYTLEDGGRITSKTLKKVY
jgi:translation initiation factor 3 subunit C